MEVTTTKLFPFFFFNIKKLNIQQTNRKTCQMMMHRLNTTMDINVTRIIPWRRREVQDGDLDSLCLMCQCTILLIKIIMVVEVVLFVFLWQVTQKYQPYSLSLLYTICSTKKKKKKDWWGDISKKGALPWQITAVLEDI